LGRESSQYGFKKANGFKGTEIGSKRIFSFDFYFLGTRDGTGQDPLVPGFSVHLETWAVVFPKKKKKKKKTFVLLSAVSVPGQDLYSPPRLPRRPLCGRLSHWLVSCFYCLLDIEVGWRECSFFNAELRVASPTRQTANRTTRQLVRLHWFASLPTHRYAFAAVLRRHLMRKNCDYCDAMTNSVNKQSSLCSDCSHPSRRAYFWH
jgi:hypothetical protein